MGEYGTGTELNIGTKTIGINTSGEIDKSTYEFNPDKGRLKIEFYLNLGKNISVKANYNREDKNYDKEITTQNSFNLSGNIKL